jgi:hypothetical protein
MHDSELHHGAESPQSPASRPRAREIDQRIAELEREVARMRGREASWQAERSRLLAALEAAEREVVELPALRQEAETTRDTAYWLAVVQASWSWRLTRPLRALSRLGGRFRGRRTGS